jgi:phosphoglycerate dehydrogenase-like enzyme
MRQAVVLQSAIALMRIVTESNLTPEEVRRITSAAPGVELVMCKDRAEFLEKVVDADAVYGPVDRDILARAKKLRWVQAPLAGVEAMALAIQDSPVVLTNFAVVFAPAISETAMGMLLSLARGLNRYYIPQFMAHKMEPVGTPNSGDHVEISGRTMGIVGLGGIGLSIAQRAHFGFGMKILATDSKPMLPPHFVSELRDPGWLAEMAPQCDVLVGASPHTPETDRIFNEALFRSMKKTAYFLAFGRGKSFDDIALAKALKEGWIAGAGLDVFPVEPPPPDHPIFDCPNVILTPHTSGWSPDRQARVMALYVDNVRRFSKGLPLINVVDKSKGY